MGKEKTVVQLALPQRVKLVDYIRQQLETRSPLGSLEAVCKEIKDELGFEVNKNILKSTCDAIEVRLDDVVEREFSGNTPVSLLHIRLNKLEKIVQEQEKRISNLERNKVIGELV